MDSERYGKAENILMRDKYGIEMAQGSETLDFTFTQVTSASRNSSEVCDLYIENVEALLQAVDGYLADPDPDFEWEDEPVVPRIELGGAPDGGLLVTMVGITWFDGHLYEFGHVAELRIAHNDVPILRKAIYVHYWMMCLAGVK